MGLCANWAVFAHTLANSVRQCANWGVFAHTLANSVRLCANQGVFAHTLTYSVRLCANRAEFAKLWTGLHVQCAAAGGVVVVALGVLGEPAAEDALFLENHFVDAPEAAEGEAADDDGEDVVRDEEGEGAESQSGDEPDPPALLAPVVFHLDDERMADADAQEHGRAYDDSIEIHTIENYGRKGRHNRLIIIERFFPELGLKGISA